MATEISPELEVALRHLAFLFSGAPSGEVLAMAMGDLKSKARVALRERLSYRGPAWEPSTTAMSAIVEPSGEITFNVFPLGGMSREYARLDRAIDRAGALYALIMIQQGGIVYERERAPSEPDVAASLRASTSESERERVKEQNIVQGNIIGRHHGGGGGRGRGGRVLYGGYSGYGGYDGGDLNVDVDVNVEPDAAIELVGSRPGTGRSATPRFAGTLADLFPVLAPGHQGVSITFDLSPTGMLTARACIDGQCYARMIDTTPAVQAIVNAIINGHDRLHAQMDRGAFVHQNAVELSKQAADAAVKSAGEVMLGSMMTEHTATICGGWWHSLTHSISHAVGQVGTGVAHTLKALKAPISIAAAGAAVAFVGPQAGPIAAQMTGSLIDAANGDASAQQVVAAAQQIAQNDPQLKQVMGAAQTAVSQATAGFHAVTQVQKAVAGDPAAQAQVKQLATAAAGGDSAAQQVVSLVNNVSGALAGDDGGAGADTGGDVQVSGFGVLPLAIAAAMGGGAVRGYQWWTHRSKSRDKSALGRPQQDLVTPGAPGAAQAQPGGSVGAFAADPSGYMGFGG